jgi:predicted transposase YbfD/YdcC
MTEVAHSLDHSCQVPVAKLLEILETVADPRARGYRRHSLEKILLIALFGVAGRVTGWGHLEAFGHLYGDWFAKHIDMSSGVPSHDTFRRVLGLLQPMATQTLLQQWFMTRGVNFGEGRQICIDGKTIRGASGWDDEEGTTNIVSAYCPDEGITLAQAPVPEGGNELSAAPQVLSLLNLKGAVVTGDAMYAQKNLAAEIVAAGGDYCFALKGNHPGLKLSVEQRFARHQPSTLWHEEVEKSRGRIETRRIGVIQKLEGIYGIEEWKNAKTIIRVDSTRQVDAVPQSRYFISSLERSPMEFLKYIRGHWSIENNLHRTLDVHFGEDGWQMRQKNAAANLSVLRKIAGSMLSQIDPEKPITHKQTGILGSDRFRDRLIRLEF